MNALEVPIRDQEEARIQEAYGRRNDSYDTLFNSGTLFLVQERERRVLTLLRQYGIAWLNAAKILEIGCGTGFWLREFVKWGAKPENITGVDLLTDHLAAARELCPQGIELRYANAARLDFLDSSFDLVLQSMAFSSILDRRLKQQVAEEMIRVTKKDGFILWYDFHINNPSNPDVRGVKKDEIKILFSGCQIDLRRITLAPPLARWVAHRAWLLAHLLERLPLARTHYLGIIRKR